MIESLHTGMMVNVGNGGEVSYTFAITSGVNQGCVLDPTLFSIFLSAMLEEAVINETIIYSILLFDRAFYQPK